MILDLDDTLVDTSDVYYRARQRFARVMACVGFDPREAVREFERIDTDRITECGIGPERYGGTMLATYESLAASRGIRICEAVRRAVERCGRTIFRRVPSAMPGADDFLRWARQRFVPHLVTRGVEDVQGRKLEKHAWKNYFASVHVVPRKSAAVFRNILDTIGAEPSESWFVGDSVKSDINPAIELGAPAILYLYSHPEYVWDQEYNEAPIGPFYLARSFGDVREIIERPEARVLHHSVPVASSPPRT